MYIIKVLEHGKQSAHFCADNGYAEFFVNNFLHISHALHLITSKSSFSCRAFASARLLSNCRFQIVLSDTRLDQFVLKIFSRSPSLWMK